MHNLYLRVLHVLVDYDSRNFLKSKWGMEEFMIADAEAVNGRKNYIIIILKDELNDKELTKELKTHLRTYTYIDGTKNTEQIPKRLRSVCFTSDKVNKFHGNIFADYLYRDVEFCCEQIYISLSIFQICHALHATEEVETRRFKERVCV